jgi:hypothetical protein
MNGGDNEQWPISIAEVARRWGYGLRRLKGIARANGIGRKAGRGNILLDDLELKKLYEALPRPGRQTPKAAIPAGPSELAVTRRLQKHLGRRGKRNYLKDRSPGVVPFPPTKSS